VKEIEMDREHVKGAAHDAAGDIKDAARDARNRD
jgi:uncharacterized protein YjbJ (UPF0337 family)